MKIIGLLLLLIIILLFTSKGFAQYVSQNILSLDPDLESGFPVQDYISGGTYQGGAVINTLVGNFDSDSRLELAETALAVGPLYVWKSDSSLLPGWPTHDSFGATYSAAGNLTGTAKTLEIVTSYWEPAKIVAYAQDGSYLPGWPKEIFGRGIAPPALADVNSDGYDEIFINMDDTKLYGFLADGTDLPGWPVGPFPQQELHTPAIADIDKDGGLEIVTGSGTLNGQVTLYAFHADGTAVTGFPVSFYGYTDTFPVIGDVDGDGNFEIVVVGGGGLTSVYVYSGNGILERTLHPVGNISYGPALALADLDGDNYPEIIFTTDQAINIWNGDGAFLPGWPVTVPQLLGVVPLVGDIDGDQALEIIVSGYESLYAFDVNGNLEPRFPKPVSGLSGAIADIDLDGRNEIIIPGDYWIGLPMFYDKVWVYDLGGPSHGKIEWGQFGGGPEHRGLYPVPNLPSPPPSPPSGNLVFIPIINRPYNEPLHELHGGVTLNGVGISNIPLELRFFDGSTWSTIRNITTSTDGSYILNDVPNLNDGESYSIRYTNTDLLPGQLDSWSTRPIKIYTERGNVGFSEFDIGDLPIKSPPSGIALTLPVTFEWSTRITSLLDWYAFTLYDPTDGDPSFIAYPYQGTNGVILYSLPSGFSYNTQYAWIIWIISPEEAIGIPSEARYITFLQSARINDRWINPEVKSSSIDWSKYPDLPCNIYAFLPQCAQK